MDKKEEIFGWQLIQEHLRSIRMTPQMKYLIRLEDQFQF